MNYKDYRYTRDLVWKILLDAGVRVLPVNVVPLCRSWGIDVKLYYGKREDGYTQIFNGKPVIFLSSEINSRGRKRFTVAHELGHILLGHVGHTVLLNREPSAQDNPIEQAANVFASRLLAPACVLWGCNAFEPEQIMRLCDISRQAAEYRSARMKELRARGKFLTSPFERAVYAQFHDYIQTHKL